MTDETARDPADSARDPAPDPTLESALREVGPEPPMEAVDWNRLASTVLARARERLARPDRKAVWWQPMAAWARPAIPLGLAAGIALLLVLRSTPGSDELLTSTPASTEPVDPADALLLGDQLAQSIYRGDPVSLLQAAFAYEDPTP